MRLNKTRQTTKALADLNRAIKSNPDDVFAYCSRGVLKVYRFIDPEGGSMDLDRAIEIDCNYADAYYQRGNFRQRIRNYDGALADLDAAIKLDPDFIDAYILRGIVRGENLPESSKELGIADIKQAARLAESQNDEENLYLATEILKDWEFISSKQKLIVGRGSQGIIRAAVDKVVVFNKTINLKLACQRVKSIIVAAPGYNEQFGQERDINRLIEIWVKKILDNKIRKPCDI